MTLRAISFPLAVAAALVTGLGGAASAVELPPGETWKFEALPPELQAKVDAQDKLWAEAFPGAENRGFFARVKAWPANMTAIRVCFFGGSPETRATIARYAQGWTEQKVNFKFDFGDPKNPRTCDLNDKPSQIRVGFSEKGYWSALGQDSEILAGQSEISLNLEDFDKKDISHPYYKSVVLHEFGHALGFNHEHQNPLSECENEFDWDKIYQELSGPPNNWDKGIVDFNMRKVFAGSDMTASEFDVDSIMLYSFKVEFYKKGKDSPCYTEHNEVLSKGDIKTVEAFYGGDGISGIAAAANLRSVLLGNKGPQTERAATPASAEARSALEAYFPPKAQ